MSIWLDFLGAEVRFVGSRYRTRILTMGRGIPVLLLHGQGGSLENFRHNVANLARDHRVIAIDLLWHGRSGTPEVEPALIPVWVDQVLDVMDSLDLGPSHIVGQSLGGWVAATIALKHRERARALVLTTPMGLDATSEPPDHQELQPVLKSQLAALDELSLDAITRRMTPLFADPANLDDEITRLRLAFYSDPAVNEALRQVAVSYLGGPATDPFRLGPASLAEMDIPTLLYWGTANFGGPAAGEKLAGVLPGARYHCAEVGHWAQYERAAEYNRTVLKFLGEHP